MVLTGAQLASLLPPRASLPPGWTEPQADIGDASDSGKVLRPPIPAFGEIPPLYYQCDNWNLQLNPGELTFLWSSAKAEALVSPPNLPPPSRFVSIGLASYQPGNAVKQLAWDRRFARRCPKYRLPNGDRVTVTATSLAGLGDDALYVQLQDNTVYHGFLLRIHIGNLVVRLGDEVIGITQSGTLNRPGDRTLPLAGFESLASWLAHSLSRSARTG